MLDMMDNEDYEDVQNDYDDYQEDYNNGDYNNDQHAMLTWKQRCWHSKSEG